MCGRSLSGCHLSLFSRIRLAVRLGGFAILLFAGMQTQAAEPAAPAANTPASTPAGPKPAPVASRSVTRPNIVVIYCDDLGYGDLGCYGNKLIRTPHLDRLATQGLRCTSFYSAQPVCSASRCGLLTGCYPNRLGIHGALGPNANHGINPDETTVAELLRSAGYATAAIGKWHLGHRPPFLPTRHGFDAWYGLPYSNDMWPHHPEGKRGQYPSLPLFENETVIDADVTAEDQNRLTGDYTDRAVKFIVQEQARPFFLYLAHTMPHVPLAVGEPFRGKSPAGLYGDVIEEIDASVGRIVEQLQALKLIDQTLILFSSDNGPWLSYGSHAGTAGPLREGKGTVWEGGVRVPCIVSWPGHVPAGQTTSEPLMTIDLLPTVAEITHQPLPEKPIDGLSAWPVWSGRPDARSPHKVFRLYYQNNELQALRMGRWKLMLPHTSRTMQGQPAGKEGRPGPYKPEKIELSLYDLEADLGETTDVSAQHPEVMARFMEEVEAARADLGDTLTKRTGSGIRPAGKWKPPAP